MEKKQEFFSQLPINLSGKMIVLYYSLKSKTSFDLLYHGLASLSELKNHVKVYTEHFKLPSNSEDNILSFLESQFKRFNGEDNPLSSPEKQKIIKTNKTHTSMSIGDVIQLKYLDGKVETWGVSEVSFQKITQ